MQCLSTTIDWHPDRSFCDGDLELVQALNKLLTAKITRHSTLKTGWYLDTKIAVTAHTWVVYTCDQITSTFAPGP